MDQAFKVASRADGDVCEFCAKRWAPVPVPQTTVSGDSGSVWRTSTKQEGESVAHVTQVDGSGKIVFGLQPEARPKQTARAMIPAAIASDSPYELRCE